jgi:hypothetical protein
VLEATGSSAKLKHHLVAYTKISDRIVMEAIGGNPAVNIIGAYAPTEDKGNDIKVTFYANLERALNSKPVHSVVVSTHV